MANPGPVPPLYLPNLFATMFGPADFPPVPQNQNWPQFPFPQPIIQPNRPPLQALSCKPVFRGPLSTTSNSVTRPARRVQELQGSVDDCLTHLMQGTNIWNHLIMYGESRAAQNNNHQHTLSFPNADQTQPEAAQVANVIYTLYHRFAAHETRVPAIATSIMSIQDEVGVQIIEFLNPLLRTRYRNLYEPQQHLHPYPFQAGDDFFFPQWGRPCPQSHRNRGDPANAGFTDFILYRTPSNIDQAAIFESKTHWAYQDHDVARIFSDSTAEPGTGLFLWNSNEVSTNLIKQLWGELVFLQVDFGVWTNTHQVFVAIRDGTTLICSKPKQWNDPEPHAALIGLSFAAIDRPMWPVVIDVRSIICPPGERVVNW